MITARKITGLFFSLIMGILLVFFGNFFIVEPMIIGDPCSWHSKETTAVFNFFYEKTSDEGYHPFPTRGNFIITLALGILIGIWLRVWCIQFNKWLKK